jgi:hypothetical protein
MACLKSSISTLSYLRSISSLKNPKGRLKLIQKNKNFALFLGTIELKNKHPDVTIQRPTNSLVFFGKDGKVIWEAP